MNASKENARQALEYLGNIDEDDDEEGQQVVERQFIRAFLEATMKKLPSEEAFQRDNKRRANNRKSGIPKKRGIPKKPQEINNHNQTEELDR